MNKTIFGVVAVLVVLLAGWYFLGPGVFMGAGGESAAQPPALPE